MGLTCDLTIAADFRHYFRPPLKCSARESLLDICSGQFKAKKAVLLSVIFNWIVWATPHSNQETATVLTVET